MGDYGTICRAILDEFGPLLGGELQEYLSIQTGVKSGNARQIVYRLKEQKKILSTDPVRFSGNQVVYFLPKQRITKKLAKVLPNYAQTFHRVYEAFLNQDGFLFWGEFTKISAGVVDTQADPHHKTALKIYEDLKQLGVVRPLEQFNHSTVVIASEEWVPNVDASYSKLYQRLQDLAFNKGFAEDLLKWLEKMNIAGWGSTRVLSDPDGSEGYNGYHWDAIGYSYIWGLYKSEKGKNPFEIDREKTGSFVAVEAILFREVQMFDISGFISRVGVLYGRLKRVSNFRIIPICFVNSIDKEALNLARSRGIMVIALADVFGTKVVEALQTVRNIDPRNIDPEALAKVLEVAESSGQDGKFAALKGYIFNFLVASIFNNFSLMARMGVKYDDKRGNKCECDIVVTLDDDLIIVCETKGYNEDAEIKLGESERESDSVKKFFERTCTIVKNVTGKEVLPVFVTSSKFSSDALDYLGKKNSSRKVQRLLEQFNFPRKIYYDRESLLELFGNLKSYTEHRKVLKEFFRSK